MKAIVTILAASLSVQCSTAQLLSHESVNGAIWGGLIGGVVGADRCHGFSGNGAAIGAGIGLLAGSLASETRRHSSYYGGQTYFYPSTSVSLGYGYQTYGHSVYLHHSPNSYLAPGYYYQPTRPNYALSGTLLGAASGALIGSGRGDAGQGALIGAAAGLALGSFAEAKATREQRSTDDTPMLVSSDLMPSTRTHQDASQDKSNTSMPWQITSKPSPTSTYFWTPRPDSKH